MFAVSAASLACMFVFFGLFVGTKTGLFLTLGITSMTICYHITVRLVIGYLCGMALHNKAVYRRKWFQPRAFEESLYKKLKVKRWKDHLPTFDEEAFSMKERSAEELIGATCQSEIVHELDVAVSLLAILFTIPFGSFWVFFITSVGGAAFDLVFVIIQRYNRPRLIKLANRRKK